MRAGLLYTLVLVITLLAASASLAFVVQMDRGTRGTVIIVHWPTASARSGVDFWVDLNSFPFAAGDVNRIVGDSFGVWEEVASSFISFRDRGSGQFEADTRDGRNVIRYDASGADLAAPEGTGVIAFTRINWDNLGEITDADIVFNGRDFRFSFTPGAVAGRVDLQAVMTHEIGHFLGLDHTPLEGDAFIRPTMYPFYFGGERTLEPDDVAGVTSLYPAEPALSLGSISGRVTHRDGSGAFGAHAVAYDASSGRFLVGALSGSAGSSPGPDGDGGYRISGLPPGDYKVAIEPLIGPVTSSNFGGIFSGTLDVDFPEEFYDNAAAEIVARVIGVGAGREVSGVDFVLGTAIPGFPYIETPHFPPNTPDTKGPYRIEARIADEDGISSVRLRYSVNGGGQQTMALREGAANTYFVDFPGLPEGSVLDYRLTARDPNGNETVFPAGELPAARLEVLSLSGEPIVYVAQRRSRVVSVFDTGLDREVARIPVGETPLSVLMTPDERLLFVANSGLEEDGSDNRLSVIETETHRTAADIRIGRSPLDMAISPDGTTVYVTNSKGKSISVVSVQSLAQTRTWRMSTSGDGPYGIAADPDGRRIYTTDIEGGEVIVIDVDTGLTTRRIRVVDSPRSLAVSGRTNRLYVSGFDGGISVIDTETETVLDTIDTRQAGVFRIAVSPDGRRLYGTDRANANLLVVDAERNLLTDVVPALDGRETRGLTVSADGSTVYVTNQDSNDLLMFDAVSLSIVRSVELGDGPRGIAVRERPVDVPLQLSDVASADFDRSGRVDFGDFLLFARAFGLDSASPEFDGAYDLNDDGKVSFTDFVLFAGAYGRSVVADAGAVN